MNVSYCSGQPDDELVRVRAPRRVLDLGVRRVVAAVGDVVAHRAVEQEDVLLHDREQVAIRAQLEVADVGAVEQDAAARRIVEARDEVGDRRLARAAAPDERDDRSARHRHVEVAHDRLSRAVLELHVLEPQLAHDAPARRARRAGPACRRRHRQHLEHALHRGERALQLGERVDDVPHRIEQQERVPLERHDVADRRAAGDVQLAAVPDDHDVHDAEQQAPRRPEHELAPVREQLLAQHRVAAAHVLEQLGRLAAERAHDADPRERLADAPVDLLGVLAQRAVDRAGRAART